MVCGPGPLHAQGRLSCSRAGLEKRAVPKERVSEGRRHRTEQQLLEGELLEIDFSLLFLSRSNSEAITTDLP